MPNSFEHLLWAFVLCRYSQYFAPKCAQLMQSCAGHTESSSSGPPALRASGLWWRWPHHFRASSGLPQAGARYSIVFCRNATLTTNEGKVQLMVWHEHTPASKPARHVALIAFRKERTRLNSSPHGAKLLDFFPEQTRS